MRMHRSLTAAVTAFVLAGCGESTTPTPRENLTDQELREISDVVVGSALAQGIGAAFPTTAPAGAPPIDFDIDVGGFAECPQGGVIQVNGSMQGTVDTDTDTGTLQVEITQTMAGCMVETSTGVVYTVNGEPSLTLAGSLNYAEGGPTGINAFSFEGGFSWQGDGRSGICTMSLQLTYSPDSRTYRGSVCGESLDETLPAS